jgi:hypothetical protein
MFRIPVNKPTQRPKLLWAFRAIMLAAFLATIPANYAAENMGEAGRTLTEYEVKAAYVFYFAKFVDWPPAAFPAKNTPITIGVVGDDEFGSLLGKIVKDKIVQEHPIQVHFLRWPADLRAFHMVFVGSSEQKRFRQIAESLKDCPVLTITETENSSQTKGVVNLFVEGGKVQFEVNIAEAEKAQLRISSKLLRLARGTVGSYTKDGRVK